jgi:CRP/FNR family transcriptional regulator, cyclic AMP receptor protein
MVEVSELKALGFFGTLSSKQLQEIADITTRRFYRANAFIYRQGQSAREIFIIAKGLVSLRGVKPGENLALAFELCEPGDLFGAASLLKDQIYTLDALCLENTDVFVVDAHELLRLCELDFELGYRLMKETAQLYFDRYEAAKRELGIPIART